MHKTREILRLKWNQGRSHREVVGSLGVSLGAVTIAVNRAQAAGLDWLGARVRVSSFGEDRLRYVHEALPEVPLMYCVTDLAKLDGAAATGVTFLRVPRDVEEDRTTWERVRAAGLVPVVSGHLVEWDVGFALADDMDEAVRLRERRRPPHCPGG